MAAGVFNHRPTVGIVLIRDGLCPDADELAQMSDLLWPGELAAAASIAWAISSVSVKRCRCRVVGMAGVTASSVCLVGELRGRYS